MIIRKIEPLELGNRQITFLNLMRSKGNYPIYEDAYSQGVSVDRSYAYGWIVGCQPTDYKKVYNWLEKNVWCRSPLTEDDRYTIDDYCAYLTSIAPIGSDLEWLNKLATLRDDLSCLTHGDCTLENFVETDSGEIVPIDPGLPRGFNHRENDVGKLLQMWLTHWAMIKTDAPFAKVEPYQPIGFPVTWYSLASLLGHWWRILKNKDRHPPQVAVYGKNDVCKGLTNLLNGCHRTKVFTEGELVNIRARLEPPIYNTTKNPREP